MIRAALTLLAATLAYGQPAFDAASVRIHQPGNEEESRNGRVRQFGLRLEHRKMPLDMLAVDRASRVPKPD